MKDFIDSLNFCQLTTIIWSILFILNIFKRNIIGMIESAFVAYLIFRLGEWIWSKDLSIMFTPTYVNTTWYYLLRLTAFALITYGIVASFFIGIMQIMYQLTDLLPSLNKKEG